MKKYFYLSALSLFCVGGGLLFTSCSDDDEGSIYGSTHPIESVTAVDGSKTITAVVSDTDKTIHFEFAETIDLSSMEVTFKLAQGVVMKTPTKPTAIVDLTSPSKIEVNNGKTDLAYTMTGKVLNIPDPIISAKVAGKSATIEGKTITISYEANMNINAMVFDLTMHKGATVKSPEDRSFNLEYEDGTLVINFMDQDYTYTVKATNYVDPLLSKGWTDETSNFGQLPEHIKIYKNPSILGDNELGYIAVMGPQSTMGFVGNGKDDKKTIDQLDTEAESGGWKVLLVGISGDAPVQTLIRNGEFVQSPVGDNSYCTIGQNKDGSYQIAWTQKFDNKLYEFPYRTGSTFTPRLQSDGTVWEPQTAVSGIPMILWNGNVLTGEQTICNDGANNGWYDGSAYARAAVGITPYGKVYAFCGQQVEGSKGLTMLALAQLMKDFGCVNAMSFEGSSSPDMHVNKKKTVVNSRAATPKGMQSALAFK